MNRKIILAAAVVVVLIVIAFVFLRGEPTEALRFETRTEEGKLVLYQVDNAGNSTKTGLTIDQPASGAFDPSLVILVSPDHEQAAFNVWNNNELKWEIYIADIDGKNMKSIAKQEVGEGNGELNVDSLAWAADGKRITYFESQIKEDLTLEKVTYEVDIETGQKTLVSRTSGE